MTKTEDRFAIISGRLRGARELHKLSAHETAIRAGVSDEEYNSWENGHPELSMEKMKKLADFYQVNVLFLLGKDFTVKVPYTKWLDDGAREDRNRCGVNDPYKRDYFDARYCPHRVAPSPSGSAASLGNIPCRSHGRAV